MHRTRSTVRSLNTSLAFLAVRSAKVSPVLLSVAVLCGRSAAAQMPPVAPAASLSIDTVPPGATLAVDGKIAGVTPVAGLPLAPGEHHLALTLPGHAVYERDVQLVAGQALAIEPQLLADVPPALPTASQEPQSGVQVAVVAAHRTAWLGVPWPTWVAAGVAASLFGVGLGFGQSASDIDHRAGVSVSPSGVDLGLTRATAVAGQRDATVANGLFIGAGVAALVGLAFAAFAPEPNPPAESVAP